MKKILISSALLCFSTIALAQEFTIHSHLKPLPNVKNEQIQIEYVRCQVNPSVPNECRNPFKETDTIRAEENLGIGTKDDGYAYVITSVKSNYRSLYPILGPLPADLSKNICSSAHGATSVSFFENREDSTHVTCMPGMG